MINTVLVDMYNRYDMKNMTLEICDKICYVYFCDINKYYSVESEVICQFLFFKAEESRSHVLFMFITIM